MVPPPCSLRALNLSATSPDMTAAFQVTSLSVVEATSFFKPLIRSKYLSPLISGQRAEKTSYVTRPRRKNSTSASCLYAYSLLSSSKKGNIHVIGDSITPSSETKLDTISFLIELPSLLRLGGPASAAPIRRNGGLRRLPRGRGRPSFGGYATSQERPVAARSNWPEMIIAAAGCGERRPMDIVPFDYYIRRSGPVASGVFQCSVLARLCVLAMVRIS